MDMPATDSTAIPEPGSSTVNAAAAPSPPSSDSIVTPNPVSSSDTAPAPTPSPAGGTPYSASFTEIMQKVQAGETLPGIKQIEDKLSADAENPTASKMTLPPKPWESKGKEKVTTKLPPATATADKKITTATDKRDALLKEAVNFLTNPKVASLSLAQKVS